MELDLEQLKKNYKTSYFAEEYERLLGEEKKINEMVLEDESLKDLASEEIQNIIFRCCLCVRISLRHFYVKTTGTTDGGFLWSAKKLKNYF